MTSPKSLQSIKDTRAGYKARRTKSHNEIFVNGDSELGKSTEIGKSFLKDTLLDFLPSYFLVKLNRFAIWNTL